MDPKLAKAPDPILNALEALVGLAIAAGVVLLKGLARPWDDVAPPKRRGRPSRLGDSRPEPGVVRDNLPVLFA